MKKDQNCKFKSKFQNSKIIKEQVKRSDPQDEDNPEERESTLFKFAKQKFGVELSSDVSDVDNTIPRKLSGKGYFNRRGNTKLNLDYYGMILIQKYI